MQESKQKNNCLQMINDFYLWQLSELLNVVSRVTIQTVADIVTSLTVILRKKTKELFMN